MGGCEMRSSKYYDEEALFRINSNKKLKNILFCSPIFRNTGIYNKQHLCNG